MNRALQKYIRKSFPEHSELTASEIFFIKYKDIDFMNNLYQMYGNTDVTNNFIVKEFLIIDMVEFFDRHENEFSDSFINANSFQLIFTNGNYSVNLQNIKKPSEFFLINDFIHQNISIKYNNEIFEYNQDNFDHNMFKFISFIKQNQTFAFLLSSFILCYLKTKTDLSDFLGISLLDNKIQIRTQYNLFYLTGDNNPDKDNISIECLDKHIYIRDYNSNVLLKKELSLITKKNFFNEIIEPLKNIIIKMDNIRKEPFQTLWKEDLSHYLSSLLFINKKDINAIHIDVFFPETKSEFLGHILHSRRPSMKISFQLNDNIASSCKLETSYKYNHYYSDIMDSYNIYKSLAEINSEKMGLDEILTVEKNGNKVKRI